MREEIKKKTLSTKPVTEKTTQPKIKEKKK